MVKKVSIKIKGGAINADFSGFVGRECEKLEERIRVEGLNIDAKIDKPEMHHETQTDSNTASY